MVGGESLKVNGPADGTRPGFVPTDDDLYWIGAMRDVLVGSMRAGQTAALAILGCALAGWVLVVWAIAFHHEVMTPVRLTLWLLPLMWWSGAVLWALRVFSIRRYRYFSNSPDSARKAVVRIARRKSDQLFWAIAFWAAGVLALVCAIVYDAVGQ